MKKIVNLLVVISFEISLHAYGQIAQLQLSPGAPWQSAQATGDYSVAVGNNALAGTTQGGGGAALLINPGWAYTNQVAIGSSAIAWGAGDISLGGSATAVSQPSLGVYASATAVGYRSSAWGNGSSAFGFGAMAGGASAGAAPTSNPAVSNATAIGTAANSSANSSTAIGAGAQATASNSVALGAGSVANQVNTVEVGSRRITGVANGTSTNDAVNLGQLQSAIAGVVGGADSTAVLNDARAYTDQAINSMRREFSRAIASVAASPSLPALAPGERAVAVGGGFYNGQQAFGVSVAHALSNGALLNTGISTAGGKPVLRAGAAFKF